MVVFGRPLQLLFSLWFVAITLLKKIFRLMCMNRVIVETKVAYSIVKRESINEFLMVVKCDWCTQVGPKTTTRRTYCYCDHLTSFGSGFVVQPNAIDFAFVFANADFLSNPTLYVTEMVIAVLYVVLFIWARRQDKKDLLKVLHCWWLNLPGDI